VLRQSVRHNRKQKTQCHETDTRVALTGWSVARKYSHFVADGMILETSFALCKSWRQRISDNPRCIRFLWKQRGRNVRYGLLVVGGCVGCVYIPTYLPTYLSSVRLAVLGVFGSLCRRWPQRRVEKAVWSRNVGANPVFGSETAGVSVHSWPGIENPVVENVRAISRNIPGYIPQP
jgi:hypothetical protein